jgi:uncharacterized membrane protein YhfC
MSFLSIIAAASTAAESVAETVAESAAESAAEGSAVASMVPEDFAFDYTMRVPVLSIVFMVIALIVMITVPVYLLMRMKNRFRFDVYAMTFGLLAYMVGVGIMPSVVEFLVAQIAPAKEFLSANAVAADILHVTLLIVFSFASIFLFFRFSLRHSFQKNVDPEAPAEEKNAFASSVIFGIGVGLLPIVTQGLSYVMSYISAAISINQGQLASSVTSMINEGMNATEIQDGLDSMATFIQTPSQEFLFLGTDLVFQMITFLGVSLLIGMFLSRKAKTSMFKAVGVQLIFGIFFAVRATGVIESSAICELIYIVVAALSIVAAWSELKTYMPDDLKKFLGKPDPKRQSGGPKNQPPHKMPKIVMPKD